VRLDTLYTAYAVVCFLVLCVFVMYQCVIICCTVLGCDKLLNISSNTNKGIVVSAQDHSFARINGLAVDVHRQASRYGRLNVYRHQRLATD